MEVETTGTAAFSPTPTSNDVSARESTPKTQSASFAAVSGKPSEYRAARRAERMGTPLPPVPVSATPAVEEPAPDEGNAIEREPAPAASTSPEPARPLSARQQKANDATRLAVERATADIQRENEALRRQLAHLQQPPATRSEPAPPAPQAVPDYKRIADMPDAPRLEQFDGPNALGEFNAAMAMHVARVQGQIAQQHVAQQQAQAVMHQRITAFDGRVKALEAQDPGVTEKIAPLAMQLGQAGGPYGFIAAHALDSEMGPQLLRHFIDHPEDLQRIAQLPEHVRQMPPQWQAQAHVPWIFTELGRLEASLASTAAAATPAAPLISQLPASPTLLGSRSAEATDPMVAAVNSRHTAAYRRLRLQQRLATARR